MLVNCKERVAVLPIFCLNVRDEGKKRKGRKISALDQQFPNHFATCRRISAGKIKGMFLAVETSFFVFHL